jgi:N-sulfoglucosamine sulfohydrolase
MRSFVLLLMLGFTAEAADRKNVVVLVADDLGLQVGCYGDTQAKTPHLDTLAKQGTRFAKAFASVASCSPSRATMLTGLPTHQNGQYGLAHATHNQHAVASVKSLPGLLSAAGYRTGVLGKLHVLPKEVFAFDEVINDGGRNPVSMVEKTEAFITKAGDKPFFLWLGYTDPHRAAKGFANENKYPASVPKVVFDPKTLKLPYHLPDNAETRAEWAEYYQSVSRLDHGVGLILKLLDDKKLAENTLVVFLSDNGVPFPGAKTTLYDSGVHLPLLIRKPGQKAGVVSDAMASWTDLAPTVLDWCGVKPDAAMQGRSLLPILDEPNPKGWDTVYGSHQFHEVTMYYPMRMVRTRTHKLLMNLAHPLEYPFASDLWDSDMWQSVLKQKLATMGEREVKAFVQRPKLELYDLVADPKELKNLADDPKHTDVRKQLEADLLKWQQATKDPWLIKQKHE